MFPKNEFYKAKARINSFKKDYGGNVIVKIDNDLQPAQEEIIFVEEEVSKNRFITTPEKTWKEEMKAGKLHFEPHGIQPAPKVFKDEEKIQATKFEQNPETPAKKKKRFCCCF